MVDLITGAVLTVLGLAAVVVSSGLPGNTRVELRPGLYPELLGAMLVLFGMVLTWQGLNAARNRSAESGVTRATVKACRPVLLIAMMVLYLVALPHLGFVLSTPAFLFTAVLILGGTYLQAVVCSVSVLSFLYLVFEVAFRVPLPHGFVG